MRIATSTLLATCLISAAPAFEADTGSAVLKVGDHEVKPVRITSPARFGMRAGELFLQIEKEKVTAFNPEGKEQWSATSSGGYYLQCLGHNAESAYFQWWSPEKGENGYAVDSAGTLHQISLRDGTGLIRSNSKQTILPKRLHPSWPLSVPRSF